jgi:hypothetical protein
LGSGASVGAVGNGDSKLMVQFQRFCHLAFQKFLEIPSGKNSFDFTGQRLVFDGLVEATILPEALFDLKALDLILHIRQELPLTRFDMF